MLRSILAAVLVHRRAISLTKGLVLLALMDQLPLLLVVLFSIVIQFTARSSNRYVSELPFDGTLICHVRLLLATHVAARSHQGHAGYLPSSEAGRQVLQHNGQRRSFASEDTPLRTMRGDEVKHLFIDSHFRIHR